jgi:hypothetical protein
MVSRVSAAQLFLMPIDPRDLADSIGLDWWSTKKLYDDSWLSFDPDTTIINNAGDEAEFRFLGSLIAAGCEPRMLKRLLSGLERPYRYDLTQIYYDLSERRWKDLPTRRNPGQTVEQVITGYEEEGDVDALSDIADRVREALDHLDGADEVEDASDDRYDFDPADSTIVSAAQQLLLKLAESPLADSAAKVIVLGKMFHVFQKLPEVTLGSSLHVELTGPRRRFGTHEIYHWWHISLEERGYLEIESGGHFYRPETGGDTFTSMTWQVSPGGEPDFSDDIYSLPIVDDADTFENEVAAMELDDTGMYELSVDDASLAELLEEETAG